MLRVFWASGEELTPIDVEELSDVKSLKGHLRKLPLGFRFRI